MDYQLKTQHYTFVLHIEDNYAPIHKRKFTIGDQKGLCLDASVFMPDVDDRFHDLLDTCTIHQLDALEECLLDTDSASNTSIGVEIMYAFINLLKANHPYVKRITFRDASYIPCNRIMGDTLDLLTYNMALYGKTWYEMRMGAHIEPLKKQNKYEQEISYYMSPEAKQDISWDKLWKIIITKNDFATKTILGDEAKFKHIFDSSKSLPKCMRRMKDLIEPIDKCKFFKGWVEEFMRSFVYIERDWVIDIVSNHTLKNVLNTSRSRPMSTRGATRKRRG